MAPLSLSSKEIKYAETRTSIPTYLHLYAVPALIFYPILAYAYFIAYDTWLGGEEWTFLATVGLGAGHALSYLVTKWSAGAKAAITTRAVSQIF